MSSDFGKGSVFSIEIPYREPIKTQTAADSSESPNLAPGQLVVIVEDDPAVLAGMKSLLQSLKFDVVGSDYAAEPEVEIERIFNACHGVPDVIIADYRLPGSDNGLDVIAKLRRLFAYSIPAILLTGEINLSHLPAKSEEGIVIVHKPVQMAELQSVLKNMAESSTNVSV